MQILRKRLLIISVFLLAFFIVAICLRVSNQENSNKDYMMGGTFIKSPQDVSIDLAASSLSRQTIQIINKRMLNLNETYFRPSRLKAINNTFMDYETFKKSFDTGTVPAEFMNSPVNSAINYFSVLQQASNLTEEKNGGCGTVGYALEPFPISYSFLSENNKKSMSYEEFVKSFEGIGHINLIKLIPIVTDSPDMSKFFLELEILEGSGVGVTTFNYYTGQLDVAKINGLYYIDALSLSPEDFFCAAYHGWAHNAESYVETVYGNWCGLISKQYAPDQDDYKKKIIIDGVDDKKYMFEFAKLTNGTDLLINTLVKKKGNWVPVEIDVEKCLEKNKATTPQ
ncbi:MAG: hypothetical protein K0R50_2033 [Eubacterium sp.]|nr:hypothetical protein [Eubacterium sp.]